ncbi:ribosomal RNA large subunit methyltransferase J [Ehrlichia chaffeensis str. Arkansas]|uniref:Ribosomal RNA large subunit methyltransferase E n=2 Tax=Ehrlichia chaffeensis TaxID=945 RepID=RLME_EHRCR|nr:RlmE family RNA methyltransferase [Ehrlichia chaffeensis]Q2GGT6.1 RecName: Full=Ribosomal RNA large subunit methyltransferase E; AltName: Full=23S rRNA Um2552 methyltransferase; AltName: Full=rRNA (uridine-2'-O-)-methyltransferase [Ehrlichia chaffeensis str. Arkansas]ABD45105.1 ribosomal RNA large subunit methyltransferase J [Ehrlichia chaffeensis str. Arkansas]
MSSTRWLHRQLNDPYVSLAKKQGYRSRATFKLIEMDSKFSIFKKGQYVLDLGSSPGGWSQFAAQRVSHNNNNPVFAVDIQNMDAIPNVIFIQCDIINDIELLSDKFHNKKFDVILSDMAPKACGNKQVDHANIINLCEISLDIVVRFTRENGVFITKILQGEYEKEFYQSMKTYFQSVKYFKPKASRKDSSEMYLVGLGFKKDSQDIKTIES